MPFIQRIVGPVSVSRGEVDKSISNELECVTNNTLSNIIRQLSSLSQHAEDMFADLYRETNMFFKRASDLNSRVEHLSTQVTQLNPTEEEVSLHDINLRKPYHSSNLKQHDQQVVARITIPKAIQDLYNKCEKPPALDKLNVYREDGKDCMKFYTDPGYFFELWYADIRKDIDKKRKELKEKRDKKGRTHRQVKKTDVTPKKIENRQQRYADGAMGAEFRSDYQVPNVLAAADHNKPVPQGYTQHNTAIRSSDSQRRSHKPMSGQNHVSNNHYDKNAMNGPVSVHSQYQQDMPDQNNQRHTQHSQSQKAHPAQNQNFSPGNRQSHRPSQGNVQGVPNRMTMAPPPPPASINYIQRADRSSLSPQRTSLPPPPPPPLEDGMQDGSPQHHTSPHHGLANTYHGGYRMSPDMNDQGLPPPPPPPFTEIPGTPPPPSPPPILATSPAPPAPPPPPPPPAPMAMSKPSDTISVSSDNSTHSSLASSNIEPPPQPKETARSALLEEIRLGNRQLRKTEERKQNTAPRDRFDVHAVMTKAFDMRRKAMEDSESEEDEDEDDWQ